MEKKMIKRLCPIKMSFREEEWLNDMLQQGWLIKQRGQLIYTFEKCDNKAQYIRVCRMMNYEEVVKKHPDFMEGKLIYRSGYVRLAKDYAEESLGYFLFKDEGKEKVEIDSKIKASWMEFQLGLGKFQIVLLGIGTVLTFDVNHLKSFVLMLIAEMILLAGYMPGFMEYRRILGEKKEK